MNLNSDVLVSSLCFSNATCAATSRQLQDFITEVVGEPSFIMCNSVGGVAGLQAAVDAPGNVRGGGLYKCVCVCCFTTKFFCYQM